ncbi:MAG: minor capsid protein [Clostridia bacterium]|nr:minor capsid protein [Clostridia bacterium]
MKSQIYWRQRIEKIASQVFTKGVDYYATLGDIYNQAIKQVEKQILVWYKRLAKNNNISLADAKKLLNRNELQEFKWSVAQYIKHGEENALDQNWLHELENASAKVHIMKLEALKIDINQQVELLYGNQVDGLEKLFSSAYIETYYHTAYEIQKGFNLGWNLEAINTEKIKKVLSRPWTVDNTTFRDKCWTRKTELVSTLHKELTQSLMRGESPDRLINILTAKFNADKYKAGRLVLTESAYFASDAQRKCYKDLDIKQYEIVATLDNHTSELCQNLDGRTFNLVDYEPGVTAPPFHPWCRTTTIPYFPDDFTKRVARDNSGEVQYIDSKIKYPIWKEKFIKANIEQH